MENNKQQPVKGQLVYVKDTEDELWDMRYFSHKKDNLYYCFNNQEKIVSSKVWNYCEVNNPLITQPQELSPVPDKIPSAEDYLNVTNRHLLFHQHIDQIIEKA